MTYTHRNGESDPPQDEGHYWFHGWLCNAVTRARSREYTFKEGPLKVYHPETAPLLMCALHGIVVYQVDNLEGRWYGPIEEPTEQEDEQRESATVQPQASDPLV